MESCSTETLTKIDGLKISRDSPFILIGKIAVLIAATNSPLEAQHYRNWSLAQGVGHQTADSDFDEDGISNILEYASGSSPQQASASGVLNNHWKIQTSPTMALDSWVNTVPDRETDTQGVSPIPAGLNRTAQGWLVGPPPGCLFRIH
jgi:hypothetical protein